MHLSLFLLYLGSEYLFLVNSFSCKVICVLLGYIPKYQQGKMLYWPHSLSLIVFNSGGMGNKEIWF